MKYEQVAFLDLDGVFKCPNGDDAFESSGQFIGVKEDEDLFVELSKTWNQEAIKHFYTLLDLYPNLKIVVSSSQRHSYDQDTIKNLFKYYPKIQERVVGRTVSLTYGNRGDEIQHYLDQNDINKFVIIDDDADMGALLPKLVRTVFKTGFSSLDIQKAKDILEN